MTKTAKMTKTAQRFSFVAMEYSKAKVARVTTLLS